MWRKWEMSRAPSGLFLHPNDVTDEGMKLLESMLEAAREAHAAALRGKDRSALAVASRDLRYWSARRATAHVLPSPTDTTEVRFGSSMSIQRSDGDLGH